MSVSTYENNDNALAWLPARRRRILLVEDNPDFRSFLADELMSQGHQVKALSTGFDFADFAATLLDKNKSPVDMIVTDVRLPGYTGEDIVQALRKTGVTIPTIVMTAFGAPALRARVERTDACAFLEKPFTLNLFRETVSRLLSEADHA